MMIATIARTHRLLAGFLLMLAGLAPAAAQTDLSVIAITQPVSGCALSSTENVTIRIFNYGNTLPAATSFNTTYAVNGGPPSTEIVTLAAPLLKNSTFTRTFTTTANLSAPGTYNFGATVAIAGDVNPANDAFTNYIVVNSAPSVGGMLPTPAPGPSGTLTLSGQTGAVVQWEESPDNQRWFKLANTTTTQAYAGVTAQTRYRVRVANGACPAVVSNVAVVNP